MADNNTSNNTNNNNNNSSATPQRKQYIPIFSLVILILKRTLLIFFSASGVLMLLSTIFFAYDYYNGARGYGRSLETYRETLDNLIYMGDWFNVLDLFTYVIHGIQDNFNLLSDKINPNGNFSDLFSMKSNVYGFKDKIIQTYEDSVNAEHGFFLGSWKGVTEFFYYYLMDSLLTILTSFLKLLMLVNFAPVYLVLILPAFANGFAERKIATFKGEYDKQDRVELAFRKLRVSSITIMYAFVAIPHSLNPLIFLVPSAILTSLSIRFMARYYKKYW